MPSSPQLGLDVGFSYLAPSPALGQLLPCARRVQRRDSRRAVGLLAILVERGRQDQAFPVEMSSEPTTICPTLPTKLLTKCSRLPST